MSFDQSLIQFALHPNDHDYLHFQHQRILVFLGEDVIIMAHGFTLLAARVSWYYVPVSWSTYGFHWLSSVAQWKQLCMTCYKLVQYPSIRPMHHSQTWLSPRFMQPGYSSKSDFINFFLVNWVLDSWHLLEICCSIVRMVSWLGLSRMHSLQLRRWQGFSILPFSLDIGRHFSSYPMSLDSCCLALLMLKLISVLLTRVIGNLVVSYMKHKVRHKISRSQDRCCTICTWELSLIPGLENISTSNFSLTVAPVSLLGLWCKCTITMLHSPRNTWHFIPSEALTGS